MVKEVSRRQDDRRRRSGGPTHELKLMADSVTPRLLSCNSSWNLIGKGAMVERSALSCARRWTRLPTYRKLRRQMRVRRNCVVGMTGKEVGQTTGPRRSEAERAAERRSQLIRKFVFRKRCAAFLRDAVRRRDE